MRPIAPLLIFFLLTCGCASRMPTVTRAQLIKTIEKHNRETVNYIRYAGTHDGDHYIVHNLILTQRIYRVPVSDLVIEYPFAYTADSTEWRSLGWDLRPMPDYDASAIINLFRQVAP